MEDIQVSYISALCASAGLSYDPQRHDDDGTDGIIKKRLVDQNGGFQDLYLRIQLKSTASRSSYSEQDAVIRYKLKAKNYNDLCGKSYLPIILGLLIFPEDENLWVQCDPEELLIRGRLYWTELSQQQPTDNASSVTVEIPKVNVVNKEFLIDTFSKLAKGEWPS